MKRIQSPSQVLQLIPFNEFEFETTRSQGPGGQSVNRTNSAVILRFNPSKSQAFTPQEIERIHLKLSSRLTVDGDLLIRSESERSQHLNREACLKRLSVIIFEALQIPKKRIATRPTRGSQIQRVDSKKKHSENKSLRKKIW